MTEQLGNILYTQPKPPDLEDELYTMVMIGLCKKYSITSPLARLVFSTLENMSRGSHICLFKPEKFAKYSGGSETEIETMLQRFENEHIIERAKLKKTNGWKLTAEVRRSAKEFKLHIDGAAKNKLGR